MSALRFTWLEGIFDDFAVAHSAAVSPAANYWQLNLVKALMARNIDIRFLGHMPEPLWPRGRMYVASDSANLHQDLRGALIDYWNIPLIRNLSLGKGYLSTIKADINLGIKGDVVITYNDSNATAAAIYAKNHLRVPWVCIVADGKAPVGADGYVFLTWDYYKSAKGAKPKIHVDGGIPEIDYTKGLGGKRNKKGGSKIIMYMGALTAHGGAEFLAKSFHRLKRSDVELWLCGKGHNSRIKRIAAIDSRIKVKGFVEDSELHRLAKSASVFVNPRPASFAANRFNFPSKMLLYLAYRKPVITTMTPGMSPDYARVCIILEEESEECLAAKIQDAIELDNCQLETVFNQIDRFALSRTWSAQANRFLEWVNTEILAIDPAYKINRTQPRYPFL